MIFFLSFKYLDKIGQLFFGMPPKQKKKDGIMGMIGMIFPFS